MIKLHFLNVGHGDCTIIEFPSGRLGMIDINVNQQFLVDEIRATATAFGYTANQAAYFDSELRPEFKEKAGFSALCDPLAYLDEHFADREIFRFIATHPHMDHLLGLADLVRRRTIVNFWYTAPGTNKPSFDGTPYREEDWNAYRLASSGALPMTPLSPKSQARGNFWTDDGVYIWHPTLGWEETAERKDAPNLASYVLAIQHGDAIIVLGGDADETIWKWLYDTCGGRYPKVTVLKAAHHGRRSGYHQPSVKAMAPALTVVSVGKKPSTDASNLYAQYSDVLSTRYDGNIVVTCYENGDWSYESDRTLQDATEAQLPSIRETLDRLRGVTSR